VTEATTVELTIETLGARGDGIGRLDGKPVYVPFTVPGDRVRIRLGARRGDGLTGEIDGIVERGPNRVTPPCKHFGACGGCAVQHLDDQAYADWKRGQLVEAFARVDIPESLIAPLVRIAPGTRRRASLGFVRTAKGTILGFARRASHELIDLIECPVLTPVLVALLPPLRIALGAALPGGAKGDAVATLTDSGVDLLIETDVRLGLDARQTLALFADRQDLARLSLRHPKTGIEPLAKRRAPVVRLGGVTVEPPPGAFLQPSAEGEVTLAKLVVDAVAEFATAGGKIADLYAGCGSFTLPLARTQRIHAVEGEAESLAALARAANQVNLNVTTESRDLARRPLRDTELAGLTAVVFDPPRVGAASQSRALADKGPKLVVAVSCNPATLARDAATLIGGGYRLARATPVDQFLWSARLEAVAVFVR